MEHIEGHESPDQPLGGDDGRLLATCRQEEGLLTDCGAKNSAA